MEMTLINAVLLLLLGMIVGILSEHDRNYREDRREMKEMNDRRNREAFLNRLNDFIAQQ
jgi:predicted histidine transporter YuiF (NhaC family)